MMSLLASWSIGGADGAFHGCPHNGQGIVEFGEVARLVRQF